ncbi:MAG: helix-turn-helix domain-containing protein, partial [Solirubrobacterales bacterium]|nr:helix-turn-helix domain-containing protein [Solirubrobacterales bacterium]
MQELIRAAVGELLKDPEPLFEAVDAAVISAQPRATKHDAELVAALGASTRSNLTHWAASNLAEPGLPVPANRAPETMGLAKLAAVRGLEDNSRAAYGVGQNVALEYWMAALFNVSNDAETIRQALEISTRSIFEFSEATLAALQEEIEKERGHAQSSANSRRLALIRDLLDSSPANEPKSAEELRYPLSLFNHTAVVIWGAKQPSLLEVAENLADATRAHLRRRPLTVMADADTVWAWFASDSLEEGLDAQLHDAAAPPRGVRIAIGTTEGGLDGFQLSHKRARQTRLLMESGPNHVTASRYRELALLSLLSADPEQAREFCRALLGPLAVGGISEPDHELAGTLRAYLQNRCSPSRTAKATFTHRNTIIDRIRRAEAYLSVPIQGHELELGAALELQHWLTLAGWSRISGRD